MDGNSLTPQEIKLKELKKTLPEVFSEGRVDWEKLQATLGEDINLSNQDAVKEVRVLFNRNGFFQTAKPIKLLKRILHLSINSNDLVLDFFSGSATTQHAVIALNAEGGSSRKCISVQLPELTDENPDYRGDLGFKVLKLSDSNFKQWQNNPQTEAELKQQMALKPQKVIALDRLFKGQDPLKTNTVLQFRDTDIKFETI